MIIVNIQYSIFNVKVSGVRKAKEWSRNLRNFNLKKLCDLRELCEIPRRQKMQNYRLKIKDLPEIKDEIERLRTLGKRIVFTNGCFDILHPGHTRYLSSARELGDYLLVAVNSDSSIKTIKGEGRPITPQEERAELLAALACVDGVVIFDQETPLEVIEYLMPDILVKGGDWNEDEIVGADVIKRAGGTVKRIPFVPGYSTTEFIKKIKSQ